MAQSNPVGGGSGASGVQANLQLQGGAAIVAPVSAFPGGVPGNALIVLPMNKVDDQFMEQLKAGPVALQIDQMWQMLGFNGPAVQVQDAEGRPLAIGLEDLIAGLEKHEGPFTPESLVGDFETLGDLGLGIGAASGFKPDNHQYSQSVWGTLIQADGTFRNLYFWAQGIPIQFFE
jgi:hypothetical protein